MILAAVHALASSIWDNQWFADVATGLIVAAIIGAPALLVRWLKNKVLAEFQNNGGSTMRDAVDEIRNDGKATRSMLERHIGHSDATEEEIFTRLSKLENHSRRNGND